MPDQFKREDRYIVIKRKYLSETQLRLLNDFLADANIKQVPLAVVVEGDWPEYEPVWGMIERRVKNERVAIAPPDSVVERCISILRGNLQAGLPDYAKPCFDELSSQYKGRLLAQARRQLAQEAGQ